MIKISHIRPPTPPLAHLAANFFSDITLSAGQTFPVYYLNLFFRMVVFELWADRAKLMSNLSITQSLSAFLHLSFIFDLQYPKVKNLEEIELIYYEQIIFHEGLRDSL